MHIQSVGLKCSDVGHVPVGRTRKGDGQRAQTGTKASRLEHSSSNLQSGYMGVHSSSFSAVIVIFHNKMLAGESVARRSTSDYQQDLKNHG